MLLYIKGKENGKLLVDSVLNGPFIYGTVTVPGTQTIPTTVRERTYDELTDAGKLHESCDIKATNIVLQGLPQDIYNLERESKLYNEFDMFTSVHGETIHSYYLRFAQLINNMHSIRMTMRPIQVNTKFINHLQPEWSKFVTDVKLAKDLNHTNFDQLYAYLRQHEAHADEVRIMKERFPNPLALVANTYNSSPSYSNQTQYHQQISPFASEQQVLPIAPQQLYDVPMIQQHSSQTPVANHYSVVHRLVVSSFLSSDDPIANLNKAIALTIPTFTSRYPPTNNKLEPLSKTKGIMQSNTRWKSSSADSSGETKSGRNNEGSALLLRMMPHLLPFTGYIADSNPEEDKEDPEEDPADHPADG
ncbi:hypothetical protein Tco_0373516 [Tanacetum coccineum]